MEVDRPKQSDGEAGLTRILLLEDNKDHALLMRNALQETSSPYEVDIATDPHEGLRMLKVRDYHLLVLDYSLPKMNGLQVLKRLSEQEQKLPVIMVTSMGDAKIAVEAMKMGAYDYLTKSDGYFDLLPPMVQKVLERHNAREQIARATKELAIAHEYLEKILSSIGDVLLVIDSNGLIQRVNQTTTELLGYRKTELLRCPIGLIAGERGLSKEKGLSKRLGTVLLEMGVVSEQGIRTALEKQREEKKLLGEILVGQGCLTRKDLTRAILKQAQLEELLTVGVINDNEQVLWKKTGESIPVSLNASTMEKLKGEFQGAVIVAHDMREMHQLIKELEEANRIKSQFLANMSHEIRTPMAGIIGMLNIASDTDLNDEQRDYLNTARESANALLDLLNDILDISKVEAGKLALETIDFDLRAVVEGVAKILAARASEKELELRCSVDYKVPCLLRGDPGRLRQILMNLGSNAIKFTKEGKVIIHVELKEESDNQATMLFSVTDTGVGIPEEQQKKIFAAFVQVDESITRRYGGTGLGLSISKQLVEMMSGQIGLESPPKNQQAIEAGKGTRFWFTAAFQKQTEPQSAIPGVSPPKSEETVPGEKQSTIVEVKHQGVHILLAEDNHTNQKVIKKMIEKVGCQVKIVDNGKQAVEALEHGEYDLVLMDVQMPEMDGYEATKAIRNREASKRHVPIIAMTAYAMKGDREQCLKAGMDDYVSKPVDPQQLRKLIEKWSGSQDKQKEKVVSASTPERNEVAPIDLKAVLRRLDGDGKLLMEVLNEFLSNVPGQLQKLHDAVGAGNAKVVEFEAHSIKGAASILSANRTAAIALQLQEMGQNGNLAGVMEPFEELRAELKRLREHASRPDFLKSGGKF